MCGYSPRESSKIRPMPGSKYHICFLQHMGIYSFRCRKEPRRVLGAYGEECGLELSYPEKDWQQAACSHRASPSPKSNHPPGDGERFFFRRGGHFRRRLQCRHIATKRHNCRAQIACQGSLIVRNNWYHLTKFLGDGTMFRYQIDRDHTFTWVTTSRSLSPPTLYSRISSAVSPHISSSEVYSWLVFIL